MISTLVPLDLEDRIMQFLRSAVPIEVLPEKVDSYKFSREDIFSLCKACFAPLFKVTDDEFFSELYTNYAHIILKIVGTDLK